MLDSGARRYVQPVLDASAAVLGRMGATPNQVTAARLALIWLLVTILFSNVVFLVVGALAQPRGPKSFYYQAGLLERTEGFILLSLMLVLPAYLVPLTYLFAALEAFTGFQRLREAYALWGRSH